MFTHRAKGSLKATLAVLCALALASPLMGQDSDNDQENLKNADFSDGSTYWHGDCKPAASELTNDFTSSAASEAKGIVVELHPSSWTKVTQEILRYKGPITPAGMVLTIVYQTSGDFSLSSRRDDYTSVGNKLDFEGATLPERPGQFLAFIDVPPPSRVTVSSSGTLNTYTIYPDHVSLAALTPATGSNPQTFTTRMVLPPKGPDDKPTFCLAFPPGTGTVTISKVSLAPGSGSDSGPGSSAGQP
jgi:hypothetical protein